MVARALADPISNTSLFGPSIRYWDYAIEIACEYGDLGRLINLEAGFFDYRLEGPRLGSSP